MAKSLNENIAVSTKLHEEIYELNTNLEERIESRTKELYEVNKKLKNLSEKDYLTGIDNRRNFFTKGSILFNTPLEKNMKMYIAMLDLDKFKNINDTYGHAVGDEILKQFTNLISNHLHKDDIFGRLGGEEFAIIIINNNEDEVISKLDYIKKCVSDIVVNNNITFTVSIGVEVKQELDKSLDEVLEKADILLYKAKDEGRNKLKFRLSI